MANFVASSKSCERHRKVVYLYHRKSLHREIKEMINKFCSLRSFEREISCIIVWIFSGKTVRLSEICAEGCSRSL